MAQLSSDKRLLEYLKPFGIGHYEQINGILFQIFPDQQDYKDFKNRHLRGRIWSFLHDMQHAQFIKIQTDLDAQGLLIVKGAIQSKGMDYITSIEKDKSATIYHFGDHAQIGHLSSPSVQSDISFQIPQITNPEPKKISKTLKIIYTIVLIIGGIITIIIGIKGLTKKDTDTKENSTKPKTNGDSSSIKSQIIQKQPRHYSKDDLIRIKEFVGTFKIKSITINYEPGKIETDNFAKELKDSLSIYYKNVQIYPTGVTPHITNERFQIEWGLDPVEIYIFVKKTE